ncbi:hypothetical protein N7448_002180, partial [Penicillium atrosanguineum]
SIKPAAPLDRPSFTFIDHDDDLTSKRIKDVNARKAIRSHVMRDVRRRERLAGLKRSSRRESRSQPVSRSSSEGNLEERRLVLRAASQSSTSSIVEKSESDDSFVYSKHRGRPVRWSAGNPLSPPPNPSPRSLPTAWFFDPFCSLPGTTELPTMVGHLVYYWKTVFVPMTFPNELRGSQDTKEVELMVRSSFSDPGSFFGLMNSTSRSVERTVNDTDYCIMKAKSIREMNAKVRDPRRALSDEAFDTIINLLTGALIAGLFDEARIHLAGLKRMVNLRGGIMDKSIRSASMLAAIITTDIKAATGLLVRPVFPLTWEAQPVPQAVQQRLRPPTSAPSHRLGSGFFATTLLSRPFIRILWVVRDIIFYGTALRATPEIIHPDDNHLFRVLNCEAEHQLLSYIYSTEDSSDCSSPGLEYHPIEEVSRVSSICFLNYFLIVSPPSSGLGRALTRHLVKAVSNCKLSLLLPLSKKRFGLFAWALFVGAQGSLGQNERSWFVERLAHVAMICKWQSFEQVSNIMLGYFYIPDTHSITWRSIWDEAMTRPVISSDEA